jgi:hypothetical protein
MSENVYKTKRSFVIPLIAIVVLLFLLFLISLYNGRQWEIIILAVLFIVSLGWSVETAKREIVITDQGITLKRFFRRKDFVWAEITQLAVMVVKKNVYFLLTTTRGFYIFSNLLGNHALLIRSLADRLGEEKVEVEVKNYLDHPVERFALIVMSWLAVVIIVGIIILKVWGI